MLNSLKKPVCNCIKNVRKLGISQPINRVYLSTQLNLLTKLAYKAGYIHTIFPNLSALFQQIYTQLNYPIFNLLSAHLYTVSTGPTITKMKEK